MTHRPPPCPFPKYAFLLLQSGHHLALRLEDIHRILPLPPLKESTPRFPGHLGSFVHENASITVIAPSIRLGLGVPILGQRSYCVVVEGGQSLLGLATQEVTLMGEAELPSGLDTDWMDSLGVTGSTRRVSPKEIFPLGLSADIPSALVQQSTPAIPKELEVCWNWEEVSPVSLLG